MVPKSLSNEEKYGQAWLMIIGNQRKKGLEFMHSLDEQGFVEASVVLAMFPNDMQERKQYLAKAARAGNPEGMWEYCSYIEHSFCPDPGNSNDREWEQCCLAAAEKGSVDAMNEMGNVFSRRKKPIESMYWYSMAGCNEQPDAEISQAGCAKNWVSAGRPTVTAGSPGFTEAKKKIAVSYLEVFSGMELSSSPNDIVALVLNGEPLAGYFAGGMFEANGNVEMAYRMYNVLAHDGDAHGTRCYADMLMAGRGTTQDIPSAMRMYERAAGLGDRAAMFITGENCRNKNRYLAAYWYGLAHTRGYQYALSRLQQLAER